MGLTLAGSDGDDDDGNDIVLRDVLSGIFSVRLVIIIIHTHIYSMSCFMDIVSSREERSSNCSILEDKKFSHHHNIHSFYLLLALSVFMSVSSLP